MKNRNWVYGLFFILSSAAVIFNQTNYGFGIPLNTLMINIVILFVLLMGLINLNWFTTLLGITGLIIFHLDTLGLAHINPWAIALAVGMAAIGLGLLFKFPKNNWFNHYNTVESDTDEKDIAFSTNFGSGIKYVNSEAFETVALSNNFGEMKVYFDNATPATDAVINLASSFGDVELYIPKDWNLVLGINNVLSDIEEKNTQTKKKSGPKVTLTGNANLSDISIIYI